MESTAFYDGVLKKTRTNDSAFDLQADGDYVIPPRSTVKITTKVSRINLPLGTVGLVCPRSGLALKHDFTVLNAPGVIDENYRSAVCVIGKNFSDENLHFKDGDRVAQLLIIKNGDFLKLVNSSRDEDFVPTDDRNGQGFGSSGLSNSQMEIDFAEE